MSISATAVRFDEHAMWVELSDGRTLGVPLAWFPRLLHATPAQCESVELSRTGLHWEDIDKDISVAGLLAGRGDMTRKTERAARPFRKGLDNDAAPGPASCEELQNNVSTVSIVGAARSNGSHCDQAGLAGVLK